MSGLNQQFAKLPYGITVPGVRIPLSPLEKPGLPESGLFRSPARGEPARQGDRERESAEAATAARLFKQGPARRGHRGKGLRSKANPRPGASLLVRETESGKAQRQRQLPGFSSKGPPGEGTGEKACGARLIPGPGRACSSGRQRAGKRRGSDSCQAFQARARPARAQGKRLAEQG